MRQTYLKEKPICNKCKKPMILDDVDYSFDGCQDEYWLCEKCYDSVFVKVRYRKACKITYTSGEQYD